MSAQRLLFVELLVAWAAACMTLWVTGHTLGWTLWGGVAFGVVLATLGRTTEDAA